MRDGGDIRPALIASIALHLAVVLLCVLAMEFSPPVKVVNVTPVTLVTSAAEPNVKPAVQAPETQTAQAPEPAPSPEPPSPLETPTPTPSVPPPPPAPSPQPKPAPRPIPHPLPPTPRPPPPPPKPAPSPKSKPPPPKPAPDLDLSSLAKAAPKHVAANLDLASLAKTKAHGVHPSDLNLAALAGDTAGGHRGGAAARGAFRPETDRVARQAVGAANALTGDELGALLAKMIPLWHPNCGVEGAQHVVIKVKLKFDSAMNLTAPPEVVGKTSAGASADVVEVAALRAKAAAAEGAPYTELQKSRLKEITLAFDAKQMCASQ